MKTPLGISTISQIMNLYNIVVHEDIIDATTLEQPARLLNSPFSFLSHSRHAFLFGPVARTIHLLFQNKNSNGPHNRSAELHVPICLCVLHVSTNKSYHSFPLAKLLSSQTLFSTINPPFLWHNKVPPIFHFVIKCLRKTTEAITNMT